jgi:tetratricopeptide (TPR) repeat protein
MPRDVTKALAFMRAAVCRPVSMDDLVRHCGAPERTLNTHFRTFLKMPPIRYLRRLRLVAVRQMLLAGEPGTSVTGTAKRCGFAHLGRFAGEYRRHFGEAPSATLRLQPAATRRRAVAERQPDRLTMRALPLVFASRPDAARRALELLDRAIEADPSCGPAIALAAWCHGQLVMYNATRTPAEDTSQALRLLRRAAVLDDEDALSLTSRCAVHMLTREFATAEALVRRALALDPSLAWAWGRSAWLHSYRGEFDAAVELFGRALSLNTEPTSRANILAGMGGAHFDAGRYEAAVFWLQRAMREQPAAAWANRTLSVSYARLGERTKALQSLDALRRFSPDLTIGQVVAALPFGPGYLDRLGEGLGALGLPP